MSVNHDVNHQVMYGPELTGHGLVLESSFPAIERHLPSGLRPASEAAQDMKELAAGLVAEIAGLMSLWAKARRHLEKKAPIDCVVQAVNE